MFYLLMIEMFLRSSFAQRISSKGQSYFHNPLFTLCVDVIGSCSLLNQNLAFFATSIQYQLKRIYSYKCSKFGDRCFLD